jgi:hypothetical protein
MEHNMVSIRNGEFEANAYSKDVPRADVEFVESAIPSVPYGETWVAIIPESWGRPLWFSEYAQRRNLEGKLTGVRSFGDDTTHLETVLAGASIFVIDGTNGSDDLSLVRACQAAGVGVLVVRFVDYAKRGRGKLLDSADRVLTVEGEGDERRWKTLKNRRAA